MNVYQEDVNAVRGAIQKKFDTMEYIQNMKIEGLVKVQSTMDTYRGFSDQVVQKLAVHDEEVQALEVYVCFFCSIQGLKTSVF